jgi:competence protein ComEA
MDWNETFLPFLKEHVIAVIFGLVGIVCLGYGFFNLFYPQQTDDSQFQNLQTPAHAITTPLSPKAKEITIDIEGAVQKPGVYTLSSGSRIQNALISAGGLSQDADRQQVAQNLNLAATLTEMVQNGLSLQSESKW